LTQYDGSRQSVMDLFSNLFNRGRSFPIIISDGDWTSVTKLVTMGERFSMVQSGSLQAELSADVFVHNYFPRSLSEVKDVPLSFYIESPSSAKTGEEVTFEAKGFSSYQYQSVTWDMGDGSQKTGETV